MMKWSMKRMVLHPPPRKIDDAVDSSLPSLFFHTTIDSLTSQSSMVCLFVCLIRRETASERK